MSDYRLTKMPLTKVHRRLLLATFASLAAALTVTRRSNGAEIVDGEGARRSVRPPEETMMRSSGNRMPTTIDLKTLGPENQVVSISSSNYIYRVTTVSGRTTSFSEFDLRFKTDSSAHGPAEGRPMLMPASMRTDRAFVVFASPREISNFIEQRA